MATKSQYAKISGKDFIWGLIMAILGGAVDAAIGMLGNGIDWKELAMAALGTGLLYLKVKYFTNSQGQLYKKEPKK
jgi:hypothetical protein